MTIEKLIAATFGMDKATWARHANPWSVWTRFTVLPALVLAFWSRTWLGWWALIPIVLAVLWTWFNPRLFPVPRSTDNWASKGVLGERVWMNRQEIAVPMHHRTLPNVLSFVGATGAIIVIWGVATLAIWSTLFGATLAYLAKLWFIDRMVWLYEDMSETVPEYRRWLY